MILWLKSNRTVVNSSGRFGQLASQSSLEEKDVGLRLVDHVVDPAGTLLDTELPQLHLRHESVGWDFFPEILHHNSLNFHILRYFSSPTEGRVTCRYSWVSSVYFSL